MAWQNDAVSKDSRTTKRTAAILKKDTVRVAIPVSALADGADTSDGGWLATLRGVPRWSKNNDVILAFTDKGTVLLSARPSNAAIPHSVLARTESFPTLVDEDDDGVTVELDGAQYRVGLIHRQTMIAALDVPAIPDTEPDDTEPDHTEPDDTEPDDTEPEDTEPTEISADVAVEPAQESLAITARRQVSDWAASLERGLLTPELPRGHVESRSRATMQCQRLLKDTYVHLSVPGKAQPRDGSDDRKGHFVIAFTNDGIVGFSANRSNKALPAEPLGRFEPEQPVTFEAADNKARHGGTLTIGGRRFAIPLLHVNRLTEYLDEASGTEEE